MTGASEQPSPSELPTFAPWPWQNGSSIPARKFLLGNALCRGVLSLLVAPGGVGKTSLCLAESVAMASAQPIFGFTRNGGPFRVLYMSLEDPQDELDRRAAAICKQFAISASDLEDRLYVQSFMHSPIKIAELDQKKRVIIHEKLVKHISSEIERHSLDVVTIDPFVSMHNVDENDNGSIDKVTKRLSLLSQQQNIAVQLVHHVRKGNGSREYHDAESARGGSSMIATARVVRVVNPMSAKEATKAGIPARDRRKYIRVSIEKQNLAAHRDHEWFKFQNVCLDNGKPPFHVDADTVGVPVPWQYCLAPDDLDPAVLTKLLARISKGLFGDKPNANDWIGVVVASELGLDPRDNDDRAKVKTLIARLIDQELLERVMLRCPTGRRNRWFIRATSNSTPVGEEDEEAGHG